jgi:NAD(P)-dependent dehydrogenase (short-subunit alcohol dehydrogenase family)
MTDVNRALAEAGAQAGAIDVLVNNAGVGDQALVDHADWARVRNILLGTFADPPPPEL